MIGIEYDAAFKARLIAQGIDTRAAIGWPADFERKAKRLSPREQARQACKRKIATIARMSR